MNSGYARVLIGMEDGANANILVRVLHDRFRCQTFTTSVLEDLKRRAGLAIPQLIVLEDRILNKDATLEEAARHLAAFAPVIVLACPRRHTELTELIAAGEVDFVARSDGFLSLMASLVKRRLRSSCRTPRESVPGRSSARPYDFAEVLRREANNPLTGILGNTEFVLSKLRGRLSPDAVERLETVVDLAVRLRETIRQVTAECEELHAAHLHCASDLTN